MVTVKIDLNSPARVQKLASVLAGVHVDFDAKSDRCVVNAKSLLGLFSLDLTSPVELVMHTDDEITINFVKQELNEIGAL